MPRLSLAILAALLASAALADDADCVCDGLFDPHLAPWYSSITPCDSSIKQLFASPCPAPFDSDRPALFSWDGTFSDADAAPGPDAYLSTNRPSFTAAAQTVGIGTLQLESGYTYTHRGGGGPYDVHSYPELNPRFGLLFNWLEIFGRYSYADQNALENGAGPIGSGTQSAAIGVKFVLSPQRGVLPQLAVDLETTLPYTPLATGTPLPRTGFWRPGLLFNYAWTFGDGWGAAGTTRLRDQIDGSTGDAYLQVAQSGVLTYSPADPLILFAEAYTFQPHAAPTDRTQYYAQAGVQILPTRNIQFDIRAGLGLNDASDDLFTGAGLSVRF